MVKLAILIFFYLLGPEIFQFFSSFCLAIIIISSLSNYHPWFWFRWWFWREEALLLTIHVGFVEEDEVWSARHIPLSWNGLRLGWPRPWWWNWWPWPRTLLTLSNFEVVNAKLLPFTPLLLWSIRDFLNGWGEFDDNFGGGFWGSDLLQKLKSLELNLPLDSEDKSWKNKEENYALEFELRVDLSERKRNLSFDFD